jgi:hypothetical protein
MSVCVYFVFVLSCVQVAALRRADPPSTGTTATNRPIVPTPGNYDDGETGRMMIGNGN